MTKYIRDGKVAVLYSPGFGAGWSTWNDDEYRMSQPNFDPYNLSGRDPYYSYVLKNK